MHRVMESSSGSPSGAVSVSSPPRSCSSVLLLDKWLKYLKKNSWNHCDTFKKKTIIGRAKGGFFSESEIRFSYLQNKLLQITILNLKFEILAHNSK